MARPALSLGWEGGAEVISALDDACTAGAPSNQQELLAALLELARSDDGATRLLAFHLLDRVVQAADEIVDALRSALVDALVDGLHDELRSVRLAAICALGHLGPAVFKSSVEAGEQARPLSLPLPSPSLPPHTYPPTTPPPHPPRSSSRPAPAPPPPSVLMTQVALAIDKPPSDGGSGHQDVKAYLFFAIGRCMAGAPQLGAVLPLVALIGRREMHNPNTDDFVIAAFFAALNSVPYVTPELKRVVWPVLHRDVEVCCRTHPLRPESQGLPLFLHPPPAPFLTPSRYPPPLPP
eukprot:tig00000949_g5747.t1